MRSGRSISSELVIHIRTHTQTHCDAPVRQIKLVNNWLISRVSVFSSAIDRPKQRHCAPSAIVRNIRGCVRVRCSSVFVVFMLYFYVLLDSFGVFVCVCMFEWVPVLAGCWPVKPIWVYVSAVVISLPVAGARWSCLCKPLSKYITDPGMWASRSTTSYLNTLCLSLARSRLPSLSFCLSPRVSL